MTKPKNAQPVKFTTTQQKKSVNSASVNRSSKPNEDIKQTATAAAAEQKPESPQKADTVILMEEEEEEEPQEFQDDDDEIAAELYGSDTEAAMFDMINAEVRLLLLLFRAYSSLCYCCCCFRNNSRVGTLLRQLNIQMITLDSRPTEHFPTAFIWTMLHSQATVWFYAVFETLLLQYISVNTLVLIF